MHLLTLSETAVVYPYVLLEVHPLSVLNQLANYNCWSVKQPCWPLRLYRIYYQICYMQSSCLDNNMKCQNALWPLCANIQGHDDQHYCCLMSSWCYFRYFLAGHSCIHTHISKLTCAISQTWRDCSCGWTRITYKERSKALKKRYNTLNFCLHIPMASSANAFTHMCKAS